MDMEQIKAIVEPVVATVGSITGGGVLALFIKSIVQAIMGYKSKKASKLTEADKKEIAEMAGQYVIDKVGGGVKLDVDAMIDKATNHRIDVVENVTNKAVALLNKIVQMVVAEGYVLADLKTPSLTTREELIKTLEGEVKPVEPIATVEQPTLILEEKPAEEKKAKKNKSEKY